MEHKIFLLVKVNIKTSYIDVHDAIKELQAKTELQLSNTKNVKVRSTEIIQLKTRTH